MKLWEGTCAPPFPGCWACTKTLISIVPRSARGCCGPLAIVTRGQRCPRGKAAGFHRAVIGPASEALLRHNPAHCRSPSATPMAAWPSTPCPACGRRLQHAAVQHNPAGQGPAEVAEHGNGHQPPAARHAARAPASHAGPGQQEAPRAQQQRLRQPRDNGQWLREGQLHRTRGGAADGVGPQGAGQETGMGKHRHQHSLWIAGHAPRKPALPMLRRHRPRVHDLPGHASPAGATPVAMPQSAPAPVTGPVLENTFEE